ncbi:hypothetical protein SPRG_01864 [Saprolegnia parasitica CBS 223.65]|uniref:Uncharacterized protein n=1 Tax=Saprolegnia parasitica (strain CBS 223.65) TaxID=695850 RepID=A0A067CQS2_SAPPC|nr:hypothetical protein SPRG_01864 [Saprolegnia parasitica CBS 223.65]KDO33049.1 hypothetical protein SPRG_01864 [Saprolegnia parasitica CBS 223.65]|eukprot:XP_012195820.1 hypothetical protein SPRG_01864 [Saprolegnia parasitica CBS 223.65]
MEGISFSSNKRLANIAKGLANLAFKPRRAVNRSDPQHSHRVRRFEALANDISRALLSPTERALDAHITFVRDLIEDGRVFKLQTEDYTQWVFLNKSGSALAWRAPTWWRPTPARPSTSAYLSHSALQLSDVEDVVSTALEPTAPYAIQITTSKKMLWVACRTKAEQEQMEASVMKLVHQTNRRQAARSN